MSSGEGSLRVGDGRVHNLPLLEKLAELARKSSFERLNLNECSLSFTWRYSEIEVKDITIEEEGKFRINSEISIKGRVLRGTLNLGLTREYLDWLPNPEEVFNRRSGGYLTTNVHLSGTIDEPVQDQSAHHQTFQRIARRLSATHVWSVWRLAEESLRRKLLILAAGNRDLVPTGDRGWHRAVLQPAPYSLR